MPTELSLSAFFFIRDVPTGRPSLTFNLPHCAQLLRNAAFCGAAHRIASGGFWENTPLFLTSPLQCDDTAVSTMSFVTLHREKPWSSLLLFLRFVSLIRFVLTVIGLLFPSIL